MDLATDTLYAASLEDFPGIPLKERIVAETRYCTALEKTLEGPDGVVKAYLAWCMAAESDQAEISAETATLANSWAKAADKARQAGMQGLSENDGAYFEVRLS